MKTFVPRIRENGNICCRNPVALCAKCQAHHRSMAEGEAPDPYADGISKMRGASVAMTAEERQSLGAFADGVATMRGASIAPVVMTAEEREQLGAYADGVQTMRSQQ